MARAQINSVVCKKCEAALTASAGDKKQYSFVKKHVSLAFLYIIDNCQFS